MIHYNLWFSLRSEAEEAASLDLIRAFLEELHSRGSVAGFQLLKNSGAGNRTKMLPYQALIEFNDDTQFGAAFAAQAKHGIHNGLHGRVMASVADFQVEIFRQVHAPRTAFVQACEI